MSDWYRNALARVTPGQSAPPPRQSYQPSPGVARWQDDRRLSAPVQQEIPDEMMPPEIRWATKLTNAARNALDHGKAHTTDRDPCPQCGSPQYFSRATNKRMPPPAPHCYNCGYNDGMFEQGLEGNWVSAAQS